MSVIPFEKSFASHEKSQFWSEKNIDENGIKINPKYVFKSTGKEYHFDCFCGHTFCVPLYSIVAGSWCPYCSKPPKKLCGNNNCTSCFENSYASHYYSKYFSDKNVNNNGNKIFPRDIIKRTGKKYLFDCSICLHSFEKRLDNDSECPYCVNKLLCNKEDCKLCYEKSFASHPKAICWDKENNGSLNPINIFKNGDKICWLNCNICNHLFEAQIKTITKGQWCPYCSTPPKRLCNDENCKLCYEKSFASHPKAIYWNKEKNSNLIPRQVLKGSHKTCWFNCEKCNHCFRVVLYGLKRGWCNYCANKILCDKADCKLCYEKSFASHPKAIYWNKEKNGNLIPRNVFISSSIICYFICNKCNNSFTNKLNHISNGVWCPFCINKTEGKLYEKIQPLYPTILTQFKQEWCKKISYLPFDFVIPEYKIIIELDGPQHFQQISNWSSPEEQYKNDKYKEQCANDNGYSVIRLLQEDVFYDTYDWVKELCETIEEIKNGDEVVNVYLCKNGEYDAF